MKRLFALFLSALLALPALANEAAIRQVFKTKYPNVRVEGVQAAPMPGLFEVRFQTQDGPQILYTDAQANFFVDGNLIDTRSGRNLTQERLQKLTAIEFGALPFDLALKVQRGNGRRVLAMFTDPYCPYCRKFEQSLLQIDDITVYVFMYPVIRPQNADHSKAVWCSPDRARAWLELAIDHKRPAASADCDNPVEKNLELGRSLGVNSTPTLILANGERVAGGLAAAELIDVLDKASPQAAKKR